jgi:hypothetical protein
MPMITVHALEYDDGNNFYGNVELMTLDMAEVIAYVLQLAGNGERLDPVFIGDNWNGPEEGEPNDDDTAKITYNLEGCTLHAGGSPPDSKCVGTDCKFVHKGTLVEYVGPLDDFDAMRTWLDEYTDHKFNLTSKDFDVS